MALESGPDRLGQGRPIEGKLLGHDPDVKEVLHPAVGDAKLDHGLILLRDDRLSGICPDTWCREVEQRWEVDDIRGGGNRIAKADINLEIDPGLAQRNPKPNPDSFVLLVLANRLGGHGVCIEAKSVGLL